MPNYSFTPPDSEPILESLDVIQNELMRLKAIEQAARDFKSVPMYASNDRINPDFWLAYNQLFELL